MKMAEPGFWDDPDKAREISQEASGIDNKLKSLKAFEERLSDIIVLAELSEDDETVEKELYKDFQRLDEDLDEIFTQASSGWGL